MLAYLASKRITWRFLLEKEPWQGGAFEILIKLVKRTLKKILGQALLTYKELLPVVTEVESTVICRPITYLYLDERVGSLTLSHLITGKRSIDEEDQHQEIDSRELLNKRLTYVSTLLKHYWNRFTKEYLLSLREYHRCTQDPGPRKVENIEAQNRRICYRTRGKYAETVLETWKKYGSTS